MPLFPQIGNVHYCDNSLEVIQVFLFRFSGNKMEQNIQCCNNQLLMKMCGLVFPKIRLPFGNTLGTNMLFSHIFSDYAAKNHIL